MKKVLVIRFSSIGDIVLTTPIIRALKNDSKFEVHYVTKEQYRPILDTNPYLSKVHTIHESIEEVTDDLIHENFDFVVDLHRNYRSLKLRRILHKSSASFPKLNFLKWMLVNFKIDRLPDLHIVDRYFMAVSQLGVTNDQDGLDYFIPKKDEVKLNSIDPSLEGGFIGFVIGGRHNTKILPVEKAAVIISTLDAPVLLLGGNADNERGDQIVSRIKGKKVINACGRYNLNQSASLVKQAKVIITNDTGLMHVASAFQKPVISIWGNTVPEFGMYPYLYEDKSLSYISEVSGLNCRPCSKLGFIACPKKHFRCMIHQNEDKIASKANSMLRLSNGKLTNADS